jgi:hypothetical protein
MSRFSPSPVALAAPALLSALAALLAGCASVGAPTDSTVAPAAPTVRAAGAPAAPASGAAAASRPAGAASAPLVRTTPAVPPGTPAPFAEVTRDANAKAGYLTIWTKDDKTWLEIPADRLNRPFFLSASLASGLGERSFWPGLMGGRQQVVELRRVANTVQMVARNLQVRAPDGTPLARAVGESYAESLIGVAPLAAAPHPDRKSLLVDVQALLGGDIPGTQTQLEASYRLPYAHDRGNSSVERARTSGDGTSVTMRSHFTVPKLPAPPVFAPGAPPPNPAALPNPPSVVPDARSLFISYTYTLAPLPPEPMKTRRADQRVGYFTEAHFDLADDNGGDKRTHLVRRWRLEKQDPAAALSEPKKPIRVVMDRNIPEKWRPTLREAILEWNKAFERAGFKNAIAVEQQANDADWSSLEGTHILAVRWFALEGPGATAVGPSQSDPRTGEILRGAAIIPENWARLERSRVREILPAVALSDRESQVAEDLCSYGSDALEEASTGLELLQMRGDIDPNSPQAERYIAGALKDVTMHEVGHALGLRHNFRASTSITAAQLRDPKYTAANGVSNSVMDYNGLNISLDGEPTADYVMPSLGAYDYWAIEYGYREFPAASEQIELATLADQSSSNPALAYSTDEDVFGIDPLVNQRDLTDDPLAHAQRQLQVARELWKRTQARTMAAGDDLSIYRRNLQRGLSYYAFVVPVVAKYVGGTYTSRALAGAQQPLLVPVPADKQRAALKLLVSEIFATSSLHFDPKFMSRLGVDQFERLGPNRAILNVDFSLSDAVLTIQRSALDALMSDNLASRLADSETKVADASSLLSYADVQAQISDAAWSEIKSGKAAKKGPIDSLRRNLQREHLRRLASSLLRPSSNAATDVRAVHRQVALRLEAELKAALAGGGWTSIAQAHLADSLATLSEALRAPLTKQGA